MLKAGTMPATKEKNETVEQFVDENPEKKFKPIIKKWLKGEKIEEKVLSAKTYAEANDYDPINNFKPSLIDMNSDGRKELAIEWDCSPTGNCEFFIYEKIGKSYRKILEAVNGVNYFRFRKQSYKSYKNIEARIHGSWNSGDGVIYRFNGKEYKPVKCFDYIYEIYEDKNGKNIARNYPTFNYYDCDFEE